MLFLISLLSLFANILSVEAAELTAPIYCNATSQCPEEFPCCSQFGQCGTGQYCINNCNPKFSFSIDSCVPMPVCKDSSTKFDDYSSKVLNADTYLNNASAADWTYSGYLVDYPDEDSMILAMPKNSGGSVLSTTRYMWYGKVSARLKSSHLGGVVSSMILFSNVQDEIDIEFIGADLNTVQTNFYWEGTLNYTNSANMTTSNTFENYHDYEIDWHEDYITWSIDGVVGRTLYKNQTYNETTGIYEFPQTPSRIQISIWPGGNATSAPGTIAWAGGAINWDAPDIQDPGYYYMMVQEANITCYDPPANVKKNGTKSYIYTSNKDFTQDSIMISDKDFVLENSAWTGLNLTEGAKAKPSEAKASSKLSSSHNSTSSASSTSFHNSTSSTMHHNSTLTSITSKFSNSTSQSSTKHASTTSKTSERKSTASKTDPSTLQTTTKSSQSSSTSTSTIRNQKDSNTGAITKLNGLCAIIVAILTALLA
ncbi:UTR2 [Nakaseomyces glabratus]|uniref:Crh-like protein n=1 Tax=Candida glabrata (strain ATCC 2001 / BCRC 20586 / JCM 3761 / NBRC 0622 / NRRL Y-65 / CBS 138) TaxID=284593 RepID=Q6FWX2_CANGA|nr:uncharacterized protein CAGL0C02211g [Nakaseomyces glabratus]KAH7608610.1 Glycosyl hydrolases family 16 (GH16) domain profile [Nakaseomyces glabratus]KAH7609485.1 Glycosyl hydrolases family 16 (GH16) domain profile [Nakaseomyces glabratus]QHS64902.1 UTR2 [Nakaseomyces glabratus]CAG58178.1 unnamed protein product [Nakaseomyces glabratus]|eukprot:XP_445272.1 uncharacterized protein CAGL0C02211g [[Candida] glabrata]